MAALKEGSEERPLRSPSTDQACLFDPLVAFQVNHEREAARIPQLSGIKACKGPSR